MNFPVELLIAAEVANDGHPKASEIFCSVCDVICTGRDESINLLFKYISSRGDKESVVRVERRSSELVACEPAFDCWVDATSPHRPSDPKHQEDTAIIPANSALHLFCIMQSSDPATPLLTRR